MLRNWLAFSFPKNKLNKLMRSRSENFPHYLAAVELCTYYSGVTFNYKISINIIILFGILVVVYSRRQFGIIFGFAAQQS